jgi:hypothetical protein
MVIPLAEQPNDPINNLAARLLLCVVMILAGGAIAAYCGKNVGIFVNRTFSTERSCAAVVTDKSSYSSGGRYVRYHYRIDLRTDDGKDLSIELPREAFERISRGDKCELKVCSGILWKEARALTAGGTTWQPSEF